MQFWEDDGHMDGGWGVAMTLGMLGFWVLVTIAIVLAVVWMLRTPASASPSSSTRTSAAGQSVTGSAERILAERLARGVYLAAGYRARLEALKASDAYP